MRITLLILAVLFAVLGAVGLVLSFGADIIGTAIALGAFGGGMLSTAGAMLAGYLVAGLVERRAPGTVTVPGVDQRA